MLRQLLHRNRLILSVQTRAVTRATLNCKRNHSTIVINATNTAPEDIIAECSKIRESIQNLNDVRAFEICDSFYNEFFFLSCLYCSDTKDQ